MCNLIFKQFLKASDLEGLSSSEIYIVLIGLKENNLQRFKAIVYDFFRIKLLPEISYENLDGLDYLELHQVFKKKSARYYVLNFSKETELLTPDITTSKSAFNLILIILFLNICLVGSVSLLYLMPFYLSLGPFAIALLLFLILLPIMILRIAFPKFFIESYHPEIKTFKELITRIYSLNEHKLNEEFLSRVAIELTECNKGW